MAISGIINQGIILVPFHFHFRSRFRLRFIGRNFSCSSDDPQLFLKFVREECKLGFRTPELPVSIFHQLNSLRPRPCIIVFNQLFTAISKITPRPPLSTLVTLYNQLELSGLRPDNYSVAILAKCYCRLGRVDIAFSLLAKHIKLGYPPDILIVNTLLNGLVASDMLLPALQLLDKSVKLGIQPDLITHGSMLKGLCRIGHNARALKLLRYMERNAPFKPNVVIYSTLIDSLCKDRLLPQALDLFKAMKAKGILPSVVTYNTLIRGLCSVGRWDEAKDLLAEMLGSSVAPNIATFNTLIDMYSKEGNVDEARAILELMTNRGVRPNVITYGALLDGYCLRGEMAEAETITDIMVTDGIVPDIVTFSSLINGYCKYKQVDKAVVMFEDMRLRGTYICPNVFTYSTLIDALCKENRLQLALQRFEEMKDRGVAPNVVTYNSLLDGLFKNSQIDMATSLRREMEKEGVAPTILTYSIILNGLHENGRLAEAIEVFSYLIARGLWHVSIYNIMIKVLCRQARLGEAIELLKEMAKNDCSPNECTYNTIIKGFISVNDVAKALNYLDIMRSQGFAADDNTTSLFVDLVTHPNVCDTDKALLQQYFFAKNVEKKGTDEANCDWNSSNSDSQTSVGKANVVV